MTVMIVLGVGAGLGLALLVVWLVPPAPALGPQLARLTAPATPPTDTTSRWPLLGPLIRLLRAAGLPGRRLRSDLAILDRPVPDHLAQKAALALAGLLVPLLAALTFATLGIDTGIRVPVLAAAATAAAGFLIPDHRVRTLAARRRRDFRHALSSFLDLVVISLAGGAGVDSALTAAASTGHGWAFTQLRRVLAAARLTRTTPWDTLRQLGCDLDIPELAELAASVALAGTEGATVRQSLQAKASALRTRQLTDAEADASADTERMSLPVMALFLGFLCFITYPAMTQVLTGF
ncbi:type II secretion system F family protein [Actinophytocola sp. NPDC049390]|uniref:type II secretion system F family protein n=1 Tax=Actinophytocola sp. NPDC049390 TaxID=3363894 RepID=UPI00379C6097